MKFKPLLKRAGLPPVRFHDLRHTCATLLLTRNVNPKIVSEMLGHSTIAITLDTYSHVLPNMRDAGSGGDGRGPIVAYCCRIAAKAHGAVIRGLSSVCTKKRFCRESVLCRRWDSNPHDLAATGF